MPFVIPEDLHPDLMPVVWLLGTWHGTGKGDYPSIEAFDYDQEVV
ncbi:MAG TPA: heme-binding beta-barrel domain-containing protein, partial [Aeromicrobium sp.]|nr:heme-binding beta-barrel domain-containing protein [Aeromicrobium sp.]